VSPGGALAFLAAQLGAGAGVLWQFDGPTIALGCASLPLVAGYPLAKRFLAWPQAVLGLTFNWGALLGWVAAVGAGVADPALAGAVVGGVAAASPPPALASALGAALAASPTPLLFYAGGAAWTQWYDTVYAFQDRVDDEVAGVKSSARTLAAAAPGREKVGLAAFAVGAGGLLAAGGAAAGLGPPFYAGLALAGGLGARQLARLDLADPAACGAAFRAHAGLGGLVWAAIVAGRVWGGGSDATLSL
jgi:4-hydroxybenzoate polyprenyltransferase